MGPPQGPAAQGLAKSPAPAPLDPAAAGGVRAEGTLAFALVAGRTAPTRLLASYPLRFLVPLRAVDSRVDCCWLYTMNYGGGLVAGDDVAVECAVGPGCTVAMTTQGSTKIYKALLPGGDRRPHPSPGQHQEGRTTVQSFRANVAAGATLAMVPDPYTCFRDADYRQLQHVEVEHGGSLVLVDWFTSGRMGRGESWAFARLAAETRVVLAGRLLLWEPLVLDNNGVSEGEGGGVVSERMGGFECFALLVLLGPRAAPAIAAVSQTQGRPTFQQRVAAGGKAAAATAVQQEKGGGGTCITSLCRLLDEGGMEGSGDALALKVAGRTTEDVAMLLAALLAPLEGVVGARPYSPRR